MLNAARRTREWALGEQRIDHGLPSVRGRPVDVAFRQLAALRTEEPGVAGELGAAVLQGWQRLAEAQGRGRGEVDVAILFTDLVSFSEWALDVGDELAVGLLREVGEAIEPPILTRGGQVVKRLGDGLVPVAWAEDGTIEGIERPDAGWLLAVQFHPEDLVPQHDASRRLLVEFVAACRSRVLAHA